MTKTNKPYYVLFSRTEGTWGVEFGDYVKSVVKAEEDEYHFGHLQIPRKDLKTIKCLNADTDTIEYQCGILNRFGDKHN